jgi:hypothetical protein
MLLVTVQTPSAVLRFFAGNPRISTTRVLSCGGRPSVHAPSIPRWVAGAETGVEGLENRLASRLSGFPFAAGGGSSPPWPPVFILVELGYLNSYCFCCYPFFSLLRVTFGNLDNHICPLFFCLFMH